MCYDCDEYEEDQNCCSDCGSQFDGIGFCPFCDYGIEEEPDEDTGAEIKDNYEPHVAQCPECATVLELDYLGEKSNFDFTRIWDEYECRNCNIKFQYVLLDGSSEG
jgi:hypothetical protein